MNLQNGIGILTPVKKFKRVLLCFLLCASGVCAQTLNVASWNIRFLNSADSAQGNIWSHRAPVIAQIVLFHDFDLWGAQEVFKTQLQTLLSDLPEYSYIGVGRDDGKEKGEFTPIFYKKERFSLLQSGHFWLSQADSVPGVGWDADCVRICTWGQFRESLTGNIFWMFNLHLDHKGKIAREKGAELTLQKIKAMCGKAPVILTGDFNSTQEGGAYALMNGSQVLRSAYDIAGVKFVLDGTFNDFDVNRHTEDRIDHIFVSPHFAALRYGVLTDSYWDGGKRRTPSDHYPVQCVLKFQEQKQ